MTDSYKGFPNKISHDIWDMKYRHKNFDGTINDETVEDTWLRIAKSLAEAEEDYHTIGKDGLIAYDNRMHWEEKFYRALEDFKFCPAGRIVAGAGTGRDVTLLNCFVMGTIPDSMDGIFKMLREAALTMQQGGGIGYDFSTIRPKGTEVKGVSSDASGPVSFMDVWNAMCKTVESAGSRRGAMMGTMRCDHPDILQFIQAKREKGRLDNFNMSVLVTDNFMEALEKGHNWDLVWDSEVYQTIPAQDIWEEIMKSTYHHAEPGVIFIDRINDCNNLWYAETIAATNPCVTGDTLILTGEGYVHIGSKEGENVDVWNGYEWSNVKVKNTGDSSKLYRIEFSDGSELECTPYHKFILKSGERVEAQNMNEGDKLVKCDWPVIDSGISIDNPYERGFFCGDGWVKQENGSRYIGLYGEKKKLVGKFKNYFSNNEYKISGGYEGTNDMIEKAIRKNIHVIRVK